jgi:hypothetical protein
MKDSVQNIINLLREQGKEIEARMIESLRDSHSEKIAELDRFKQIAGKMYCKM